MFVMFLVLSTGSVFAENSLTISCDKTEVSPNEQVKIIVQALDANQIPLTEEVTLLIKLSRGGLLEPQQLKTGLTLTAGVGEFTYIAPSKPGKADLLLIDPVTNLSARLSFKVIEEPVQTEWKKEFAKITKVKGQVAYKPIDQTNWNSAINDVELHEGDSIRTWEKSWVTLELFDGTEITLEPWTTLHIKFLQSSIVNADVKQSVFKIYTGNVLCKVKKYVEKGSRFEIETESTAAGIRGTVFELISSIEGDSELIVYEGSVIFESLQQEMPFLINSGQRIVLPAQFETPEIIEHNITPEERETTLIEEQNATQDEIIEDSATTETGEEPSITDETSESPVFDTEIPTTDIPTEPVEDSKNSYLQKFMPSNTHLNFGSQLANEQMYFAFSIQPEFKKILGSGLSLGLNLTLYQDPATGEVHLGSPDETVKLSNFINWLEYDGKYTYLKYSYLQNITYGYGLLMNNYSKEKARGIQIGLDNLTCARLGCRVLLPFDITSFYPWQMEETSTLYAARVTSKNSIFGLPMQVGATVITDTNDELRLIAYDVPTTGIGADASLPGFDMIEPYTEIAYLNQFGIGGEVGIRGHLFSYFWYQTGFRVMGESFIPNYFGDSYEEYKKNSLDCIATPGQAAGRELPDLYNTSTYAATSGAYFNAGANLGLGSFKLGYENYQEREEYAPILTADFLVSSPKIFNLPTISCGFNYKQLQFNNYRSDVNRFFNKNTKFAWFITLPITSDLSINFVNRFIPSDETISYSRELNISVPF